jgi:sugar fermentation stimulation protein A
MVVYEGEFIEGEFIERPNRFLSLVRLGDREEYAHLPNPGRIRELLLPGVTVILKKEYNPNRKTRYTLIMTYKDGIPVSLNTTLPNALAAEAIEKGKMEEFKDHRILRREAQYKNSRFDLLLSKDDEFCFLEVKSVTLVKDKLAMFPDAPTIRGTRHINHLMEAMDEGYGASILFVVQRSDAEIFTTNDAVDPKFADALRVAYEYGVNIHAYKCKVSTREIHIDRRIDVLL